MTARNTPGVVPAGAAREDERGVDAAPRRVLDAGADRVEGLGLMADGTSILDQVGNTPLVALSRLVDPAVQAAGVRVLAKLEGNNPASSVKDRPALAMITAAEARGEIRPGDTLIEATSGNTGIALATLYAPNGWLGRFFPFKIAFTPTGIWIALVFVSLPFIVRAVQPVLEELSGEYEEAAATLGAGRFTTFRRVLLPEIAPALLTGAGMMFARATGEFGSVIFIAGNVPMVSEILPLIITGRLEQYDVQGASAVALFMLLISFSILFALNIAQWALGKRAGAKA